MTAALLVMGFGNHLRGDDAAGLVVAEQLREGLPGATVLGLDEVPVDLYERWTPASTVVLVDAGRGGGVPGTVRRFDARAHPLPAQLLRVSTHGGGVAEAVELARALSRLPASLVLFAIEGEAFERGAPVSQPVARAIHEVVNLISAGWGRSHA